MKHLSLKQPKDKHLHGNEERGRVLAEVEAFERKGLKSKRKLPRVDADKQAGVFVLLE